MKPTTNSDITDRSTRRAVDQVRQVLLVGADASTADGVESALASTDVVCEAEPIDGLVRLRDDGFSALLVGISAAGMDLEAILRAYRKVSPDLFIVLLADMWDEPIARELISRELADEYAILPLRSSELLSAFKPMCAPSCKVSDLPPGRITVSRGEIGSSGDNGLGWPDRLARETAELIHATGRGIEPLLERICWSAIFLFNVRAVRVEAQSKQAQAGDLDGNYDREYELQDEGEHIGKVMVQLPRDAEFGQAMVGIWLQLLPGLIRLAGVHGQLQELANTEPLTGLANRRHMMEVLENLLARARKERSRVTLVLFDFDDFKHYNDAYGHPGGDEILRESAILIRRCIRRHDLAARFGGDEIALILWDAQSPRSPGSDHPRSPIGVMKRFCKLLKQHHFSKLGPQARGSLTISGGLATFPWDANTAEELIEKADQALLEAKRSGKNRVYLVGQSPETELGGPAEQLDKK